MMKGKWGKEQPDRALRKRTYKRLFGLSSEKGLLRQETVDEEERATWQKGEEWRGQESVIQIRGGKPRCQRGQADAIQE